MICAGNIEHHRAAYAVFLGDADSGFHVRQLAGNDDLIRCIDVAGAYHSRLMESAYVKLEKVLADVPMQAPRFPVISNVTGEEVKTPEEIRETLRDQVTGTVRWTDCMQRLIHLGCDFFIELGPGNVLAGLLKRTNRGINVISVGDAESVRKCGEAL